MMMCRRGWCGRGWCLEEDGVKKRMVYQEEDGVQKRMV